MQEGLRGRLRARLPRHPSAGAGACAGDPQGRIRLAGRFLRRGAGRAGRRFLARRRQGRAASWGSSPKAIASSPTTAPTAASSCSISTSISSAAGDEPSHGQHASSWRQRGDRNDRPPRADRGRTSLPLAAVRSPWAQSPWKGYYATGTRAARGALRRQRRRDARRHPAAADRGASCRRCRASCWWRAAARPTATATIRWRPNASIS